MSKTKTQQRKHRAKHKKIAQTRAWRLATFGKKRRPNVIVREALDEAAGRFADTSKLTSGTGTQQEKKAPRRPGLVRKLMRAVFGRKGAK
jgi:hypothetical protein